MKKKLVLLVLLSLLLSLTVLAYNGDTIVYVTESGTKYHSYGCSYLAQSCYEITLEEAANNGYTCCSKCDPPIPDFEVQATPMPERESPSGSSTRSSTESSNRKAAVDKSLDNSNDKITTESSKVFRLAIGIPCGIVLVFVLWSISVSLYEAATDWLKRK